MRLNDQKFVVMLLAGIASQLLFCKTYVYRGLSVYVDAYSDSQVTNTVTGICQIRQKVDARGISTITMLNTDTRKKLWSKSAGKTGK